jgi:hypothetical protein
MSITPFIIKRPRWNYLWAQMIISVIKNTFLEDIYDKFYCSYVTMELFIDQNNIISNKNYLF